MVTIRKAILRGSFSLVLGAIALSTALSFYEFRQSLQAELAGNLHAEAQALMERIDTFLFERMEDIRDWRRLEIMQDIRVNDVDKRLARFLSDLQAGHGAVYRNLFCTDLKGRIVAASDKHLIGRIRPPGDVWLEENRNFAARVMLEPLQSDADLQHGSVALRVRIPDAFHEGDIGYLYAVLNWDEVLSLLDRAADSARSVLLLDGGGKAIAASRAMRVDPQLSRVNLDRWYAKVSGATKRIHRGGPLGMGAVLVGTADSKGYQYFRGFGWHMLMTVPTRVAFAPVWRLFWIMLGVLLVTLLIAGWVSLRLSERIARPIGQLTRFTRLFRRNEATRPPHSDTAVSEVRELSRAFSEMIEALERSRAQLVTAGKLAVVGEMAAIMAHEVRTPLGILRSSAQLLERQVVLDAKGRELTGYIKTETERLNQLVTTLLECARPRPPDFKPHDLHDIVRHVVELIASNADKKGIHLEVDLAAASSILSCDREQLIQVFLNLIINAIHFAPEGGRIRISSKDQGGAVIVAVADDGPGIPAGQRQQVFDPFFTRREGGIGLGLTIVQQIVRGHNGEIWVGESPWGGASFFVRLPGSAQGEAST
ncbi:MAG TPA: HAMP domain-containing sensor histidine kinase [Gammaproteobacteria bacterium]|nr:HAMP domain-containing sensor histidine kinase [Gammaproteobacteria bacterium]